MITPKRNPTVDEVLEALQDTGLQGGHGVWTALIANKLRARDKAFRGVRTSLVKARLEAARKDGMVERDNCPLGNYGYSWTITEAAKIYLSKPVRTA